MKRVDQYARHLIELKKLYIFFFPVFFYFPFPFRLNIFSLNFFSITSIDNNCNKYIGNWILHKFTIIIMLLLLRGNVRTVVIDKPRAGGGEEEK